jgi:hypothetical protein
MSDEVDVVERGDSQLHEELKKLRADNMFLAEELCSAAQEVNTECVLALLH